MIPRKPREVRLKALYELASADTDDCSLWDGPLSSGGYPNLSRDRMGVNLGGHVLVCIKYHGPKPLGSHALHSCDHRACVNPRHLRWDTHAANMRDVAIRERSRSTVLTAEQVLRIREYHAVGFSQSELATRYGVSKQTIWRIVHRETWRHI